MVSNPLYYQFGAYQTCAELLRALFPDGEDRPPRLKDEGDQAWTLVALANSYSLSGQPRRAVPLFEQQIAIREKQGVKISVAIGLGNLADDQLKIGELRAAEANLRRRIELCREIEDAFREAIGHRELGRLLAYRGVWDESKQELDTALAMFEQEKRVQGQGVTWAYRAQRLLLMSRATALTPSPLHSRGEGDDRESRVREALSCAQRALELADEWAKTQYPVERDYVRAHWLLGAANLACGKVNEADRHLTESLTRCRGINLVEVEADILLDLARLRAAQANRQEALTLAQEALTLAQEALTLAQEALTITERCSYVLQGADVHLFLARLALEGGDTEDALAHAKQARDLAACDGGEYTYKVAYEEANALLRELSGASK
jgi:tetratricopeptide (TPR) repeat protein